MSVLKIFTKDLPNMGNDNDEGIVKNLGCGNSFEGKINIFGF
jgi:hypothetical protein